MAEGRTVAHSAVTMAQVMMPPQSGPGGVWVHGGEIMKLMDTAGVAAVRHAHSPVATARVEGINFLHPVRVGNFVIVNARLTFVSQASMEVEVRVTAEDLATERSWPALSAYFIFVAVDEQGKPKPVPPLILSTDEERQRFEEGRRRYERHKAEISS